MSTEGNRCFGLVITGVEGEVSVGEGVWGLISVHSKCIWLDVEVEAHASNNWIGCNFKPFKARTIMMSTKNGFL